MKIRIYSPLFPYPVTEGAFQIIFDQARYFLEKGHSVELVMILEGFASIQKKLRAVDFKPPGWTNLSKVSLVSFADFGKGTLNLSQLEQLEIFEDPKVRDEDVIRWNRFWRVVHSLISPLASPELYYYPPGSDLRRSLGEADLAIYHYGFSFSWLRGRRLKREKKRAVVFHNLESELFKVRAQGTKNRLLRSLHELNSKKLLAHEKALASMVEEIWFLSPIDRRKVLNWEGKALLRLVPPTYDEKTYFGRREKMADVRTPNLGFIGGLDFPPNADSARWILKELAPRLAEKGFGGKILIVGKNASEELRALAKPYKFVDFLGFVRDLELFWSQVSMTLVPHVSGSGVRMKLLESVASGVPCLANPDAVERLHPEVQRSPLVITCKSIDEWVNAIMNEPPFGTRKRLMGEAFSKGLEAGKVYEFLGESNIVEQV